MIRRSNEVRVFSRQAAGPLVPLLVITQFLITLVGFAPGLVAQQYCVSGAVTSILNCNGCDFNVGDPVATTFTVTPSSITCYGGSSECIANTDFDANVGGRSWTGQSGGLLQVVYINSSTTQVTMGGSGALSPLPSSGTPDAVLVGSFALSGYPGNLIASGTLPAGLPSPAAVTAAKATLVFEATSSSGATPQFSYTGQTCASTASASPTVSLVQNAEGGASTIAPNTWVTLKGSNFAPAGDSRIWQASDFVNNELPTQLDGVSVKLNGESAYVYYISPTQINILTPPDMATGTVQVQAATNVGTSASFAAQAQAESPSFFIFGGGPYVAATHGNGSLLGPTSLYPGQSTPAQPGETIVLYANGFGLTTTPVVSGSETQSGSLNPLPVITIGGAQATVQFAGLISPGLFQFNVVVPTSTPAGDNALTATYSNLSTQSGVLVAVGP